MDSQSKDIPSGYESVEKALPTLKVTRDDMPWLPNRGKDGKTINEFNISLAQIKVQGIPQKFYLGSLIESDDLIKAAQALDKHRSNITNQMFYSRLPRFLAEGKTERVINAKSKRPVYYFKNDGGQRVYFMKFETGNEPVIIRVAACDKNKEDDVLVALTTQTREYIRRSIK